MEELALQYINLNQDERIILNLGVMGIGVIVAFLFIKGQSPIKRIQYAFLVLVGIFFVDIYGLSFMAYFYYGGEVANLTVLILDVSVAILIGMWLGHITISRSLDAFNTRLHALLVLIPFAGLVFLFKEGPVLQAPLIEKKNRFLDKGMGGRPILGLMFAVGVVMIVTGVYRQESQKRTEIINAEIAVLDVKKLDDMLATTVKHHAVSLPQRVSETTIWHSVTVVDKTLIYEYVTSTTTGGFTQSIAESTIASLCENERQLHMMNLGAQIKISYKDENGDPWTSLIVTKEDCVTEESHKKLAMEKAEVASSDVNELDDMLASFAKDYEGSLPLTVDQWTTLENVTVVDKTLVLEYKSSNASEDFIQSIVGGVVTVICEDEYSLRLMNLGGQIKHSYTQEDGWPSRTTIITIDDCITEESQKKQAMEKAETTQSDINDLDVTLASFAEEVTAILPLKDEEYPILKTITATDKILFLELNVPNTVGDFSKYFSGSVVTDVCESETLLSFLTLGAQLKNSYRLENGELWGTVTITIDDCVG